MRVSACLDFTGAFSAGLFHRAFAAVIGPAHMHPVCLLSIENCHLRRLAERDRHQWSGNNIGMADHMWRDSNCTF